MKKVLLATTALVATAGFAAAEISLSGSASMGLQYTENGGKNVSTNETVVNNELDFTIAGSGTTDSGVAFGASIDFGNSETDQQESHDTANDGEAFVSYNGFTVTVGDVGNQTKEGVADVGFQGIGADDLVTQADTGNYDVNASYTISGITIGASLGSDSQDSAVSVSGAVSGVSFGVSSTNIKGIAAVGFTAAAGKKAAVLAKDAVKERQITEFSLGYTMGAVSINAAMSTTNYDAAGEKDVQGTGLSVSYTSGAMTLTAAMSDTDAAGQETNYGVGVAYDLGGGLAVKAGYGQLGKTSSAASKAVADLGLTMSF